MIKLREIPHRIRAGLRAADIYNLAHRLKARQASLARQMVHDDPAGLSGWQLDQITWDRLVSEFFAKHPDTLRREAVWLDLDVADELLLTLQDMYDAGGRLWAFLVE